MSPDRDQRLGRLLKAEISRIFLEEINDPFIKAISLLTVTDVVLSPDLKVAKVYVSLFGESEQSRMAFDKIKAATPFVRFKLSESMRELKFVPELRFYEDNTAAEAARIMELLKKIEQERTSPKPKNEPAAKNKKSAKKR